MTHDQKALCCWIADALEKLQASWPQDPVDIWACSVPNEGLHFTAYLKKPEAVFGNGKTPMDAVTDIINRVGVFDPGKELREKIEKLNKEIAAAQAEIQKIEPVALAIVQSEIETAGFDAGL